MSAEKCRADGDTQLNPIPELDREGLVQEWRKRFGNTPPKYTSSLFLKHAVCYELQCKEFGGLSAETKRKLRSALPNGNVGCISKVKAGASVPQIMAPGTQLVREWNGRNYQVQVTEHGFLMDGKDYKSLSAIANKITGAKWSGPRFFGLNGKANPNQVSSQSDGPA